MNKVKSALRSMTARMPRWFKVLVIVAFAATVIVAVRVVIVMYGMLGYLHDRSYAEYLELDLTFVDGLNMQALEEFFEHRLSRDDLTEYERELFGRQQDERYDLYLLSRVTPRRGLEMEIRYRRVSQLVIELIEPDELRGKRYTVVPEEGAIQLPGEACYGLTKVQSRDGPRSALDTNTRIRYKVVHIHTE